MIRTGRERKRRRKKGHIIDKFYTRAIQNLRPQPFDIPCGKHRKRKRQRRGSLGTPENTRKFQFTRYQRICWKAKAEEVGVKNPSKRTTSVPGLSGR